MSHRTQIYLDHSHYSYLRALSRKLNKSLAQIIRDLIDEKKSVEPSKNQVQTDAIFRLRGTFSDDSAAAVNFDALLYGESVK